MTPNDCPLLLGTVTPAHFDERKSQFKFAKAALEWRHLAAPSYAGRQQLVYKIGHEDVRRGSEFCYDISALENASAVPGGDGS